MGVEVACKDGKGFVAEEGGNVLFRKGGAGRDVDVDNVKGEGRKRDGSDEYVFV